MEEAVWLEPALALLRKKTKEGWTERHRNVARKLVLEGGWVQKRLFDIGWSDESECQACHEEKGTEKHRLYHCPEWHQIIMEIPEAFRKWEQKARTSNKEWMRQRGIVEDPPSESMEHGPLQYGKVGVGEAQQLGRMPAEGFKCHVVTDSSLLGTAGKWEACGWAVVQLDYDEEMQPLHGMYGSMEAEF